MATLVLVSWYKYDSIFYAINGYLKILPCYAMKYKVYTHQFQYLALIYPELLLINSCHKDEFAVLVPQNLFL